MKFLGKKRESSILKEGLTYQEAKSERNRKLKNLLLAEQKNFCAYTEKYIQPIDSVEVEHFNQELKYKDDYFNYYAVLRWANQSKKDHAYKNAGFFTTLFFQDDQKFRERVRYVGGFYEETDQNDSEARDLIDFLGFNNDNLYRQRRNHINRLLKTFKDANYSPEQRLNYFRGHKEGLNFITAIEIDLNLNLAEFYS